MLRLKDTLLAVCVVTALPLAACSDDGVPSGMGGDAMGTGGNGTGGNGTGGNGTGGNGTGGNGTGGNGTGGMSGEEPQFFNRVSSFLVCSQTPSGCETNDETAAEIVAATDDGMTLVYSDSPAEFIGFVDITDPSAPVGAGTVAVGGEPTSVAVKGKYALVGVVSPTSTFVSPAGSLKVFDMQTKSATAVAELDLGGQPDSVALSPDGHYAAIAIENERDEDFTPPGLEEGDIPQLPAGKLVVVDTSDADPGKWTTKDVDLTGLSTTAPSDPEPEFVDINDDNVAVVSLQENNWLVLVDLAEAKVTASFSAGTVDLTQIDLKEDDGGDVDVEAFVISMTESLSGIPREPDGVAWIGSDYLATADEGDWLGGSRGFTIFEPDGTIVFSSGNTMDHLAARFGHYPDSRSGNKGNEPENVEFGEFGDDKLLFVNSERSSLIFVYDVAAPEAPVFKQVLPAAVAPEGGLAIPSRDLLVVASEADEREAGLRSAINIYQYGASRRDYPTIQSQDRSDGTPIPWAALSGLAAGSGSTLYSIEDSFYGANRIFTIDTSTFPATLTDELTIVDTSDVFAGISVSAGDDATSFTAADLALMINADKTVNIDPEGISVAEGGGFWVASEGSGTVGDAKRPIESLNLLFEVSAAGVIEQVVMLPDEINAKQLRFGFEGVAEYDGKLYVAFQRAWAGDSEPRIGIYDIAGKTWEFVFYPLEAPASPNGGWVGLSDITSVGEGKFLVVERDNQFGPDGTIKALYQIDLSSYTADMPVAKTLVDDLTDDIRATGGLLPEKIEGSAYDANGNVWIVNDNDGVDDNSGETQLINLGQLL